jgi:hypothetical protein
VSRRIATTALVLAWLCANGALWDAVQVAAWGKMFAGYRESMSITAALRETFDASKPCDVCICIANAKTAADTQAPISESQAAAKFLLAMHVVDGPIFTPDPAEWCRSQVTKRPERTDPVPVPPPRV